MRKIKDVALLFAGIILLACASNLVFAITNLQRDFLQGRYARR